MDLYILQGDQPTGPYDKSEVIARWKSGRLRDSDLVWKEGLAEWTPLEKVITVFVRSQEEEPEQPVIEPQRPAINSRVGKTDKDEDYLVGRLHQSGIIVPKAKQIVDAVAEWTKTEKLNPADIMLRVSNQFLVNLSYSDAAALLGLPEKSPSRSGFYILQNNVQIGPIEEAELIQRLKRRTVRNSDLLWADGLNQWTPVGKLFSVEPENLSRVRTEPVHADVISKAEEFSQSPPSKSNAGLWLWQKRKQLVKDWPQLVAIGLGLAVILFLFSWSYTLSMTLLCLFTLLVFVGSFWGGAGGVVIGGIVALVLFFIGLQYVDSRFPQQAAERNAASHRAFLDEQERKKFEERQQHQRDAGSGGTEGALDEIAKEQKAEATRREKDRLKRELSGSPPD